MKLNNIFRAVVSLVLFGAVMLSAGGCKKPVEPLRQVQIEGEWKLESFSGVSVAETGMDVDVYIKFTGSASGGRFELFQKLGGGHWSGFDGTWSLRGSTLSGKYSDGSSWGSDYSVESEDGRLTMTSLSTDSDTHDVCRYVSSSIPDSVRKDASDYAATKSPQPFWPPVL